MGTRTSFRPRPVDPNKPLPIVRDLSELDSQQDGGNGTTVTMQDIKSLQQQPKKPHKEIPTPEVRFVETYHRDYLPVFQAASHYAHGKGGSGYKDDTVVEYDLDNEDEDWLEKYNLGGTKLSDTKFERMLWKLELACAEATEDALMRAGASVTERNSATALAAIDHLPKELALEVLLEVGARDVMANDVYEYWAAKRRRWGKPILRRLQAPTSASDTNPFNVFRPREKVNRPQTRRRRDNPDECLDKLRQMQDNIRSALQIVCEIIRRERRKRDLMHTEIELQRIRLRQRHDARVGGSLEEAAQAGMAQLKARNSKNRELDVIRAGARLLANGVRIEPTVRPSKRQRRPELLPYLRAEVAKLAPPPGPPPEEDMPFTWALQAQRLKEINEGRAYRAAIDERDAAVRRALANSAPPPPPLPHRQEFAAAQAPVLVAPEGVALQGTTRLRLARGGRAVLDRCDAWSLEPLPALMVEERAYRQYLAEPWPQLPKGAALREIVDRVRPPPRPNAAAAAGAAAQQVLMMRQSSAAGSVGPAAAAAAAAAAAGSRMGSQGSMGYPLVRLPSGAAASTTAGQASGLGGAASLALAPSLPPAGLPPSGPAQAAAVAAAAAAAQQQQQAGVKDEPVQATVAGVARQASVGYAPGDGAGAESPTAGGGPPKRVVARPPK